MEITETVDYDWALWLTSIIPACWEAQIRKITV
jgi:hypothetical protein